MSLCHVSCSPSSRVLISRILPLIHANLRLGSRDTIREQYAAHNGHGDTPPVVGDRNTRRTSARVRFQGLRRGAPAAPLSFVSRTATRRPSANQREITGATGARRPTFSHPSLSRAHHGRGRARPLPGGYVRRRPAHRRRLLLRLLRPPAIHAGGHRTHRGPHARDDRERRAFRAAGTDPRGCDRTLCGPALQARNHRCYPRGRRHHHVRPRRVRRSVPWAARRVVRRGGGVQADERRGRLLARRRAQRDASAHLRHGVGIRGRAE